LAHDHGRSRGRSAARCRSARPRLDTAFLEAVEFLAGLAVEILAVDHKEALFDDRVDLEQRGGLKAGERLTAAGSVPDVAVAAVLIDALDDVFDGVDLVGPHHQELLLAGHQHHVAADHLAKRAFGQKGIGEIVKPGDPGVVGRGILVDRQKALVGVEAEVTSVVVGEVVGRVEVADDEHLHEAQQRAREAVPGIVLVIDDLLYGTSRVDAKRLQFDLDHRDAVDEKDDVEAVVAVVGVDAQLVDDFEAVLAPVIEVDQRIVERRAVFAGDAVAGAQRLGCGENVGRDDLF
jgi:hypothetical protein